MAGLVSPSRGDVLLDGAVTRGPNPGKGMVFQEDSVFPWLTVQQNVEYGLRARGLRGNMVTAVASRWIQAVGLEGFADAYPRELSGGMRKRVDLARVYATDPEGLLMDEPFGALDALTREALQADLLSLWQELRKTVVFVTHDLDEAAYLADVVVFMSPRPGRVTAIVPVTLGRPRSPEVRTSPEFFALTRRLRAQFGQEERRANRGSS
jgi:NitT/TauT family transport system ATP-binding protein